MQTQIRRVTICRERILVLKSSRRKGRSVNGVLLLDKPEGSSSNAVLQQVRRLYGAAKAGHTGSLDPLATGMLPICFGEATKFSQYLLDADKHYRVIAKLGEKTTTGDAEGEVIKQCHPVLIGNEQIEQVVGRFIGPIEQVPPMYSALKHQGQPLYKLARKGVDIERCARKITIYSLNWHRVDKDHIEMTVHCSKGTYIRSLVEDIGDVLGCFAHVKVLRRLQVGSFAGNMSSLEQLREARESDGLDALDQYLLPVDVTMRAYPCIVLDEKTATVFHQGRGIHWTASVDVPVGLVQVWSGRGEQKERFLGVGEWVFGEKLLPRRLIQYDEA